VPATNNKRNENLARSNLVNVTGNASLPLVYFIIWFLFAFNNHFTNLIEFNERIDAKACSHVNL
jgi:hypothetical protein